MSIQYFNIPVLQCDDTTPGLNFHELYDFWIPDVVSLPKQDNGGSLKLNESTKFLTVFEPWNPDTRVFQTWNPTPGMVPGLFPQGLSDLEPDTRDGTRVGSPSKITKTVGGNKLQSRASEDSLRLKTFLQLYGYIVPESKCQGVGNTLSVIVQWFRFEN